MLSLILSAVTIGHISSSIPVLICRVAKQPVYMPLILFLLAAVVLVIPNLFILLSVNELPRFIALSLPALLSLSPLLWLYIEGLTSENKWNLLKAHLLHFILPAIGLMTFLFSCLLPNETLIALVIQGDETALYRGEPWVQSLATGCVVSAYILILAYIFQSSYYLVKIHHRLQCYQSRLFDVFSSHETKELSWVYILLTILTIAWGVIAVWLLMDNLLYQLPFPKVTLQICITLFIWLLVVWGLRQKPGFESIYISSEESITINTESLTNEFKHQKYQHSALSNDDAIRIANKLKAIVVDEKLCLEPNLSLQTLASKLNINSNYISQTLNVTLNSNFFDYVNRARVDEAKRLLKSTELAIVEIAYQSGFNAKSSFYKAFKQEVGMTPSEYRKAKGN